MLRPLLVLAACLPLLSPTLPAQEEEGGSAGLPPITPEQKERLGALLPPLDDKFKADPDEERLFLTDNLFELIDGAAPAYFKFGFVALAHACYKVRGIDLTVDIYDMDTPLQAFGIYAAERDSDGKAVPVGASGVAGETYLDFFQGRYYVKIESTGSKDKEMASLMMRDTAEVVSKRIRSDKSFPEELDILPDAGRLPWTRGYEPKAPLAMESLAPAVKAGYRTAAKNGKGVCTLWISLAGSEEAAQQRAADLKSKMKADSIKNLPDLGPGAFSGKDEYTGPMVVVPQGTRLLILVDPPADPAPLVKACAAKMKKVKVKKK
jgi:hypothetical protein